MLLRNTKINSVGSRRLDQELQIFRQSFQGDVNEGCDPSPIISVEVKLILLGIFFAINQRELNIKKKKGGINENQKNVNKVWRLFVLFFYNEETKIWKRDEDNVAAN